MLLIVVRRNIDSLIKCGNGKKDGEARQWLNKGLVEQAEQHMAIAIDYIRRPYTQT